MKNKNCSRLWQLVSVQWFKTNRGTLVSLISITTQSAESSYPFYVRVALEISYKYYLTGFVIMFKHYNSNILWALNTKIYIKKIFSESKNLVQAIILMIDNITRSLIKNTRCYFVFFKSFFFFFSFKKKKKKSAAAILFPV